MPVHYRRAFPPSWRILYLTSERFSLFHIAASATGRTAWLLSGALADSLFHQGSVRVRNRVIGAVAQAGFPVSLSLAPFCDGPYGCRFRVCFLVIVYHEAGVLCRWSHFSTIMPRMFPDSTDHSTHRPFLQPAIPVTCATQTEPGHVQRPVKFVTTTVPEYLTKKQ